MNDKFIRIQVHSVVSAFSIAVGENYKIYKIITVKVLQKQRVQQ